MPFRVGRLSHAAILLTVLWQTAQPPARIGDVARDLDAEGPRRDRAPRGGGGRPAVATERPWRRRIGGLRHIEVYLTPTTVTQDVRRGSVLSVVDRTPAGRRSGGASTFVSDRGVASNEDRNLCPGRCQRPRLRHHRWRSNINRPFRTLGEFGDGELISLVISSGRVPADRCRCRAKHRRPA